MPADRYVPDLSEVPPDPADPFPVHHRGNPLPPLTDAEIDAALAPLARDIEQDGGRLEVRYDEPPPQPSSPDMRDFMRAHHRFVGEHLHRLTGAGSPADGDPPLTGKLARAMIADALPPRHGKSLGGAMTIADLMRPKEPPELPPSPVEQAALVVDPEE